METVLESNKKRESYSKLSPISLDHRLHKYRKAITTQSKAPNFEAMFQKDDIIFSVEQLPEEIALFFNERIENNSRETRSQHFMLHLVKCEPTSNNTSICLEENDSFTLNKSSDNLQETTDKSYAREHNSSKPDALLKQLEVHRVTMKRMIPVSLATWVLFFSVLSSVFLTVLYISLKLRIALINPWYLFPLIIGSIGMIGTSFFAIYEWRKNYNASQKKKDREE